MFSRLFGSTPAERITVKELHVFPIKSCRGNQVEESPYGAEGLEYDRQWMIVEEKTHKFLTARTIPKMILIHPIINRANGTLDITVPSPSSSPGGPSTTFSVSLVHPSEDLAVADSAEYDFEVWGTHNEGFSVGSPELIKALSEYMGRDVLLVRKGKSERTVAEVPGVVHSEGLEPVVSFADFYSLLVASATSLADLTSRIPSVSSSKEFNADRWSPEAIASKGGLEITRFRANILVEGVKEPWVEDGWKQIKIGEEVIECGFRCARCLLPSVDPATGIRDKLLPDGVMKDRFVQPLSTGKVCYGMLSSPKTSAKGWIRVGDAVEVLDAYEKPKEGPFVRSEDMI